MRLYNFLKKLTGVKKFDVWEEGYITNGMRGTARLLGTYEARSFQEACDLAGAENDRKGGYKYDPKTRSIWGCRLFNNEAAAREYFG